MATKNYKKKIYTLLGLSLLIVIISFGFLFMNFARQTKLLKENLSIKHGLSLTDSMNTNWLELESNKRGFQLTRDSAFLSKFILVKENLNENVYHLKNVSEELGVANPVFEIESLLKERFDNLDSGLYIFNAIGLDSSVSFMQQVEKKNIRKRYGDVYNILKSDLLKKEHANNDLFNKSNNNNKLDLLFLLVLFIIGMFLIANTVKKSQQKIIKNHIRFQEAQRIAKIGSWEWDISNNKITWSKEQYRLFGEDPKTYKITYEGYLSHLSETDKLNTSEMIMLALEGKKNFELTHEIIRKDGTSIIVFEQGTVLYDDNGKARGMFGTTQDISERKKVENELAQARKSFETIFDNAADGVYQSSVEGKFLMANPAVAKIFGYNSPKDLLKSVTNIGEQHYADPDDRVRMAELLSLYDHIENYEVPLLTKNKAIVWVSESTRIVRDEKGEIKYYEGTLKDITERKRAEEELGLVQKKYQEIFNNTADGIYHSTIDGRFIMVNPSMAKIFGFDSPLDMIKSVTDISTQIYLNPEDRKKMSEILKDHGEVENFELQVLKKNKDIIWVSLNIRIVRNDDGDVDYFEGTLEDITKRKESEEEIMQLNKSLDQFANITAHDLQEPIRMVSGFLGLLEKKYSGSIDEQGKSFIYRAKDGADRMSILIKDLLEFSRSGNKAAKKEPVDMGVVMDLVKKDLSIVVADTNSVINIPEDLPVVNGTQSALYRLFLNLISNGIKFRKKDISPVVTLDVEELPDYWSFTLKDNGIGVAEKDQAKLFQAFQRLHRREEYPGTGLGLVTCKKIVETHGGKIGMTSEAGKGTAFHFTLSKALLAS